MDCRDFFNKAILALRKMDVKQSYEGKDSCVVDFRNPEVDDYIPFFVQHSKHELVDELRRYLYGSVSKEKNKISVQIPIIAYAVPIYWFKEIYYPSPEEYELMGNVPRFVKDLRESCGYTDVHDVPMREYAEEFQFVFLDECSDDEKFWNALKRLFREVKTQV